MSAETNMQDLHYIIDKLDETKSWVANSWVWELTKQELSHDTTSARAVLVTGTLLFLLFLWWYYQHVDTERGGPNSLEEMESSDAKAATEAARVATEATVAYETARSDYAKAVQESENTSAAMSDLFTNTPSDAQIAEFKKELECEGSKLVFTPAAMACLFIEDFKTLVSNSNLCENSKFNLGLMPSSVANELIGKNNVAEEAAKQAKEHLDHMQTIAENAKLDDTNKASKAAESNKSRKTAEDATTARREAEEAAK
ncbi:hypothetical protein T484DRAFT_1758114, partial [Baffinella frigidus]